ncbi:MAG: PD40 domain-containing protein, partial [Acidobacteria bacterium]|nr:PD40 domain-containing protein [Acidobacteriota bacterium]
MAGKALRRDRRIGRPPAGARRGERVRDYPQISIRLPLDARAKLSALARVTGLTRWRLIVKALEELAEEWTKGTLVSGLSAGAIPRRRILGARLSRSARAALAVSIVAGVGVAAWMMSTMRQPAAARRVLTRMTSDSGLSAYPALSPDGKLVAYASDRAGEGSLDIWVRQVAGGEAIRLTRDREDEYEPSFSADGSAIVFRSERGGGGVYIVSALGGEARLVAQGGRQPRFSPDGRWIAFWTGATGGEGFGEQRHLVSRSGDASRRLVPEFGSASHPVWSPDGTRILFLGKRNPGARWPDTADWFVVSPDGGQAAAAGAIDLFGREAFDNFVTPEIWLADTNTIVFSRTAGDTTNLWEVSISPRTGRLAGPAR